MAKCHELKLNAEIEVNANKVQAALKMSQDDQTLKMSQDDQTLKMSQDDQTLLESLKQDVEKAWIAREAASEKEVMGRNTTTELKKEVANLPNLIELQKEKIDELLKANKELTSQLETKVAEVAELVTQLTEQQAKQTIIETKYHDTQHHLTKLEENGGQMEQCQKEKLERDLKDANNDLEQQAADPKKLRKLIKKYQRDITRMETWLQEAKIMSSKEDYTTKNVHESSSPSVESLAIYFRGSVYESNGKPVPVSAPGGPGGASSGARKPTQRSRSRSGKNPDKNGNQYEDMEVDESDKNDDERSEDAEGTDEEPADMRGGDEDKPLLEVELHWFLDNVVASTKIDSEYFSDIFQAFRGHLLFGTNRIWEKTKRYIKEDLKALHLMRTIRAPIENSTFREILVEVEKSVPSILLVQNVDLLPSSLCTQLMLFIRTVCHDSTHVQVICVAKDVRQVPADLMTVLSKKRVLSEEISSEEIEVKRTKDLKPGDQIAFPTKTAPGFADHHAIVVRYLDHRRIRVVQHAGPPGAPSSSASGGKGKSTIRSDIIDVREHIEDGALRRVEYYPSDCIFSGEVTVRKAQRMIGKKGLFDEEYSVLTNNCEHFSTFCKTGFAKSKQL